MSPSSDILPVALYGRPIAELHRDGEAGMHLEWDYSWPPARRGATALSASLRFGLPAPAQAASNFFGGYLPEGTSLDSLADDVGVSTWDVFGLLRRVGADLAGALVVGDAREHREPRRVEPAELPGMLERASGYAIGGGGSALPGFQRKLTLTRRDGAWWLGRGTWPSTHILKPAPLRAPMVPRAEAWALDLARTLGLTTFDSHAEVLGGLSVLVVERYDREIAADGTISRIHQEDAAQALGLPWRGDEKFERARTGASLEAIAGLLDLGRTVTTPNEPDVLRLLRYTTFNLAIGNTDAHAKNHSILRPETGQARLAPLYDTVPLAILPDDEERLAERRQQLALRINGAVWIGWTTIDDLTAEAGNWGIAEPDARAAVADTLDRLGSAAESTPSDDAEIDELRRILVARIELLRAGLPTDITAGGNFHEPIAGLGVPIGWTRREPRRIPSARPGARQRGGSDL